MLKIISGAQTGVDRGALNAALASQIPCGGWCPADRRAEDGIIAPHYPVTPLLGAGYRKRTRQNVIDSDATIIIYHTQLQLSSGTALTLKTCLEQHKPFLLIDAQTVPAAVAGQNIAHFVRQHGIRALNFGGTRRSIVPMIESYTEQAVACAIQLLANAKAA